MNHKKYILTLVAATIGLIFAPVRAVQGASGPSLRGEIDPPPADSEVATPGKGGKTVPASDWDWLGDGTKTEEAAPVAKSGVAVKAATSKTTPKAVLAKPSHTPVAAKEALIPGAAPTAPPTSTGSGAPRPGLENPGPSTRSTATTNLNAPAAPALRQVLLNFSKEQETRIPYAAQPNAAQPNAAQPTSSQPTNATLPEEKKSSLPGDHKPLSPSGNYLGKQAFENESTSSEAEVGSVRQAKQESEEKEKVVSPESVSQSHSVKQDLRAGIGDDDVAPTKPVSNAHSVKRESESEDEITAAKPLPKAPPVGQAKRETEDDGEGMAPNSVSRVSPPARQSAQGSGADDEVVISKPVATAPPLKQSKADSEGEDEVSATAPVNAAPPVGHAKQESEGEFVGSKPASKAQPLRQSKEESEGEDEVVTRKPATDVLPVRRARQQSEDEDEARTKTVTKSSPARQARQHLEDEDVSSQRTPKVQPIRQARQDLEDEDVSSQRVPKAQPLRQARQEFEDENTRLPSRRTKAQGKSGVPQEEGKARVHHAETVHNQVEEEKTTRSNASKEALLQPDSEDTFSNSRAAKARASKTASVAVPKKRGADDQFLPSANVTEIRPTDSSRAIRENQAPAATSSGKGVRITEFGSTKKLESTTSMETQNSSHDSRSHRSKLTPSEQAKDSLEEEKRASLERIERVEKGARLKASQAVIEEQVSPPKSSKRALAADSSGDAEERVPSNRRNSHAEGDHKASASEGKAAKAKHNHVDEAIEAEETSEAQARRRQKVVLQELKPQYHEDAERLKALESAEPAPKEPPARVRTEKATANPETKKRSAEGSKEEADAKDYDPMPHLRRAVSYTNAKDYHKALVEVNKALLLNSHLVEARYQGALIYQLQGRTEDAMKRYRDVLRVDPNYTQAHINLGVCYRRLDRLDDAEDEYRKAVELNFYSLQAHYNLANVLIQKNDLEAALKELKACVKIAPDNASVHNNLGVIYEKRAYYEEAEEEFLRALNLSPANQQFEHNLEAVREKLRKNPVKA
jgi:tetratricopeptide (TPR) repeat protein